MMHRKSQTIRPAGLSVEKPIEAKTTGFFLRQNIKLPPAAITEGRRENKDGLQDKSKSSKKRNAEEVSYIEETCTSMVKRKRANGKSEDFSEEGANLSLGQLRSGNFWFQTGFDVSQSVPPIADVNALQVPFNLSCSGEEERMCFVPGDVMAPPPLPPLSNNPWFDVDEMTDLGDKNVETSQGTVKEASGSSSSSSESRGLVPRLSRNPVEHETVNGSKLPNSSESAEVAVAERNGENDHTKYDDNELVSLLVACIKEIGSKNIVAVNHCLARLGDLASPHGSPISRLIAYFTEGLALRVARLWPRIFHITTPWELDRVDDECGTALRLLSQVSPIPKFIHFTSNEILLRAFEGKDRVHIIDFDIKQGMQWPSLFQSLASRTSPPSHVRITGIGKSKQELIETGDRLSGFAAVLNLPFVFHPVIDGLEDVRLWMLHIKENESVAVNCICQMHKMLYDSTGGMLRDFLSLVQSTNPTVVLMAEQEAEHNEPGLQTRLANSLKYYSAIFDSVDSSLPLNNPVRIKIEEMFAREIRNIIACEGRDRYERHETFKKWQQLMEQWGFCCMGIKDRELLQSQMLLKMYSCENFRVRKQGRDGDALSLSWLDQPLYTISAWAPVDVAGSSSSYSQPS
ncbi:Scarecrow-like protein 28 [Abeliophyllum distichum]|uniref:Scarecrow-like protein 28 n=1 Tax=Abeliophyllum distichum TaxID=126358 RepID=A0ABD1TWC1_9LAMI